MNQKKAIMDLGSNTFHLSVGHLDGNGRLVIDYHERRFIHLLESAPDHIGEAAFERGLNAIMDYSNIAASMTTSIPVLTGTAALRVADNSSDFTAAVKINTGLDIQVIDGDNEAGLITEGVLNAPNLDSSLPLLIMDIGGGSTEFILIDSNEILFSKSYPLGASVLRHAFHQTEPIQTSMIEALMDHLKNLQNELRAQCCHIAELSLIGASGSFSTLTDVLGTDAGRQNRQQNSVLIPMEKVLPWIDSINRMTLVEREAIPHMPPDRAKYIVAAGQLIRAVLEALPIRSIQYSPYALKEGALIRLLKGQSISE